MPANSGPAGKNWTSGSNRSTTVRSRRKGRYHYGRQGGGAWKVAYADFVTAMMAFFLVMWITGQSKAVKEAIAQYFHDPWKTSAKPTGDATAGSPLLARQAGVGDRHREAARRRVTAWTAPRRPERQQPRQEDRKRRGRGRPSLMVYPLGRSRQRGDHVFFAEHSAELDEAGKRQLKKRVAGLRGKPHKIEIRGQAPSPLPPGRRGRRRLGAFLRPLPPAMKFLADQRHRAGAHPLEPGRAPSSPI